jgi:hypothetical protein
MAIIGLVGFIGSGKGTAGDILQALGFTKESFAGSVKDIASVMFGWPRHLLEGDTEESRLFRETPDKEWTKRFDNVPFTPREALQKIGTEVGRNIFHRDFWVQVLESKIDKSKNYVITDVRFPNEIEWIKKQGGLIIEIQRDKNPPWYDSLSGIKVNDLRRLYMNDFEIHESEWAWVGQGIDYAIQNNTTKRGLYFNLMTVLTNTYETSKINKLQNGELNEIIK